MLCLVVAADRLWCPVIVFESVAAQMCTSGTDLYLVHGPYRLNSAHMDSIGSAIQFIDRITSCVMRWQRLKHQLPYIATISDLITTPTSGPWTTT
jgi:hypothetical protein